MLPDRIANTFKTAAQALSVQRERIAVASRNIANAQSTASANSGKAYRPQRVITSAPEPEKFLNMLSESVSGLKTTNPNHRSLGYQARNQQADPSGGPTFEVQQQDKFRYEFDPGHPDADENGMVRYPDVDMVREMAEMVSANRLYEANLSSIEAEKQIIKRSLEI